VNYRIIVEFQEISFNAGAVLFMSTSSLGFVIIPPSNWIIREGYAGGNLLRVSSSCAVGYQYNHPTNPTA
jgi:hypothetical protein